jgi:hypothetical protein
VLFHIGENSVSFFLLETDTEQNISRPGDRLADLVGVMFFFSPRGLGSTQPPILRVKAAGT